MRITDGGIIELVEDWEGVVQWMARTGPSLEDFTDCGAYCVMTLAINAGVSLPTLKCLLQARGLRKIKEEHQTLINWYFHF
jgi:hypothetical protein